MPIPELPLTIIKEDDFLIEESDSAVFITGTVFTVPVFDQRAWGQKDIHIRGYDVTLAGDITAPSKSITIATRTLRVTGQRTIAASGEDGQPWPAPANNGIAPGQAGETGEDGRPGQPGGTISIRCQAVTGDKLILVSTGGNGGPGQNGGSGEQGQKGDDGRDASRNSHRSHTKGEPGGRGRQGGSQGRGGKGGAAGNGGEIILDVPADVDIECDVSPGAPGAPGHNGKPGAGGIPGRGGRNVSCRKTREHHPVAEPW